MFLYTDETVPPWRKCQLLFRATKKCRVDALIPWDGFRLIQDVALPVTLEPGETVLIRMANETGIAHAGGVEVRGGGAMISFLIHCGVALAGILYGRRWGIRDERLRATYIFDAALCVVSSGALHKVRRCIRGDTTLDEMRRELVREVDARQHERDFWRRHGR